MAQVNKLVQEELYRHFMENQQLKNKIRDNFKPSLKIMIVNSNSHIAVPSILSFEDVI